MVNVLQVLLAVIVGLLMLGLGATVRQKDLARVRTRWKAPLLGFLCQYGFMPLAAFLLAMALGVSDVVAVSIIAIGSTPGGSTSNLFTLFSKGDVALSITMTVLSTGLAFGMFPLLMLIYTSHLTDDLRIPFLDILTALLLVIIPAALGIAMKHYRPVWAAYAEKAASILGVIFILGALIFGSVSEDGIWTASPGVFVAAALLMFLGAGFGYLTAWLNGFPRRICRTIALETGLQNSSFTLSVLAFSFGGEDQDQDVFNEIVQFPLLYSFFLVVDGALLTALFHYLAQFDPEEEKAEYAEEEAERAAEIAAELAAASGKGAAAPEVELPPAGATAGVDVNAPAGDAEEGAGASVSPAAVVVVEPAGAEGSAPEGMPVAESTEAGSANPLAVPEGGTPALEGEEDAPAETGEPDAEPAAAPVEEGAAVPAEAAPAPEGERKAAAPEEGEAASEEDTPQVVAEADAPDAEAEPAPEAPAAEGVADWSAGQ